MKKFLITFLATMAAIWLSLMIAFFGFFIVVTMAVASSSNGEGAAVGKKSILHLDLSGEITDRPAIPTFQDVISGNDTESTGLNDVTGSIILAAKDDNIEGIFIECNGSSAGVAQRQAIVKALKKFKDVAPEKWIYAYSDMYTQGDYLIASAADSVFLNPIGQIDIHGLSSTGLYFKDLLQKIGVEAQVVKVGTYKSAVEPYLLDSISKPAREQQELYLKNIWGDLAATIAEARGVTVEDVNNWANGFTFAYETEQYVKDHIVDRLVYRHEMDDILAKLTDKKSPKLVSVKDYRNASGADDFAAVYATNPKGKNKVNIAVLYATGDITVDGKEGIASDRLVPQIMDLIKEKDIDGLILRVNSGGGSAFASEQIWEALGQFKKVTGKPFYVSMGDVAASGGYYISCGADRIYAEPVTLTGSIGIFGIIPNAQKLLNDKLGINTSTVSTNPLGESPTLFKRMTPRQASAMQLYVDRGYELFTRRCAEGRGVPVDSIKKIAEGRVWDGLEAKRIGLVDELGGLDRAIADMGMELQSENVKVKEYPVLEPDVWSMIFEAGADMKARAVKEELGVFYPWYKAVNTALEQDPLQCRMEFIELH